jgi:hypothetical protein
VTRKLALIVALIVGLAGLSAGLAIAASGGPAQGPGVTAPEDEANESNDSDGSLTGMAAEKAADAALAAVGGGTLLEAEPADDDGGAYEVEIRKPDGSVVEVLIGSDYRVVNIVAGD